jgi:hypothetical protein
MQWVYDDGGRAASGYKGEAGDCVVRAIAIAAELPYVDVYAALMERNRDYAYSKRGRTAAKLRRRGGSPRNGNFKKVYHDYILSLGFRWIPTMQIGQGCKVHLRADELPKGRIIVSLSKHLAAVVDGVLHDTYDDSRDGKRCVYGMYVKESQP